jgi:hypothetical protein
MGVAGVKSEAEFRTELIEWIVKMRKTPGWEDYASSALAHYVALLPWMKLNSGVKQAMSAGHSVGEPTP